MERKIILFLAIGLSVFLLSSCKILHKKEMIATTGEVCFDVQPASAELYIDGKYVGMAKGCMTLDRGPHFVQIEKKNFIPYEREIYVGEAQQVIRVKLSPERFKSKIPPVKVEPQAPPGQIKEKPFPVKARPQAPPEKVMPKAPPVKVKPEPAPEKAKPQALPGKIKEKLSPEKGKKDKKDKEDEES
jgi:hypothetical protein